FAGVTKVTLGAGAEMVTPREPEYEEMTTVSIEHRAMAATLYVPAAVQVWLTLVVPLGSQSEFVPSPQTNWYWTECPRLETEPPVVNEYAVETSPVAGPVGCDG